MHFMMSKQLLHEWAGAQRMRSYGAVSSILVYVRISAYVCVYIYSYIYSYIYISLCSTIPAMCSGVSPWVLPSSISTPHDNSRIMISALNLLPNLHAKCLQRKNRLINCDFVCVRECSWTLKVYVYVRVRSKERERHWSISGAIFLIYGCPFRDQETHSRCKNCKFFLRVRYLGWYQM